MKVIKICPACSNPAIDVEFETVSNLLKIGANNKLDSGDNYWVCTNSTCNVTYFSKTALFHLNDIKVLFWFKDHAGPEVPICYCSNISRNEIMNAMKNGCTTIDDVQAYTKKNITGNCLKENPLGNCCRDVFLFTMGKLESTK